MLELKLICYCGQKYKFDVEPVNGLMPFTVKCPVCHLDGTARANEMLAHLFAVPPKPAAPAAAKAKTPLPPPPAPVRSAAPPLPSAFASVPAAAPLPPMPPPAPALAGLATARGPATAPAAIAPPLATALAGKQNLKTKDPAKFNLGLGIAGAVAGSSVGCGLMYGFWVATHFRFPIMGVVVGVCGGFAARWLGRGGNSTLGIISAVIAGASVAGTLVLMYGEFPTISIVSVIVCAIMANRTAS